MCSKACMRIRHRYLLDMTPIPLCLFISSCCRGWRVASSIKALGIILPGTCWQSIWNSLKIHTILADAASAIFPGQGTRSRNRSTGYVRFVSLLVKATNISNSLMFKKVAHFGVIWCDMKFCGGVREERRQFSN